MLNLREILRATKGELIRGGKTFFKDISTDSRNIKNGALFIALNGPNFDGHSFIKQALINGASGVIVSKNVNIPNNVLVIKVKDTLQAFHDIAIHYKNKFELPFVGITGSSGKTTTKDMLATILSRTGKTLRTEANFNNEIGVPKTIFGLNKHHKFAVIEMAMQGLGEIDQLTRIVEPNIAIITNIGSSHMQALKNKNNIAKAKSEILKYQNNKDYAVLPADDEYYNFLKKLAKGKVLSFGIDRSADVRAVDILYETEGSHFTLISPKGCIDIKLPLPGKHNILDSLAAASAAIVLNVPLLKIKKGLSCFKLSDKRMSINKKNGIIVIDDTYNASPDSMAASLKVLANYKTRKIAVLGDMLELGNISNKSHKDIGILSKKLGVDILVTVGRNMELAGSKLHFASTNKALSYLNGIVKKNDTILVKGSRGMHMESIVTGLIK